MARSQEKRTPKTLSQARKIEAERGGKIILRRGTKEAIQRRREHVWKFFLEGTPQTVMAELLQVSRRTIHSDLAYMKAKHGKALEEIKGNPEKIHQELAVTTGRLRHIANQALFQYDTTSQPAAKDRFLNTAIRAEWVRTRLEMEAGVLPKAGEEIRIKTDSKVTFAHRLGVENAHLQKIFADPARARKVLDAFERVTRGAIAEDPAEEAGEIIDVDHKALPAPDDDPE